MKLQLAGFKPPSAGQLQIKPSRTCLLRVDDVPSISTDGAPPGPDEGTDPS
ncbi:MAG: hypothetical protein ACQESR_28540 [Planctomycetota bacterium]